MIRTPPEARAPTPSTRVTGSCPRTPISRARSREAGLVWIGPAPDRSQRWATSSAPGRADAAGVPVVPGSAAVTAAGATTRSAEKPRDRFPCSSRRRPGGGGKGMSRVERSGELAAGARGGAPGRGGRVRQRDGLPREALRTPAPRRVPGFRRPGRPCLSPLRARVQRPAPAPEDRRGDAERRADARAPRRDGQAAVEAARAVRYVGAGTVEFLLDPSRRFLFPRDEHAPAGRAPDHRGDARHRPRARPDRGGGGRGVAAGWREGALRPRGHAIELRLYAEDPVEFLPRAGRLLEYEEPRGPGIRVDAGVGEGIGRRPRFRPAARQARRQRRNAAPPRSSAPGARFRSGSCWASRRTCRCSPAVLDVARIPVRAGTTRARREPAEPPARRRGARRRVARGGPGAPAGARSGHAAGSAGRRRRGGPVGGLAGWRSRRMKLTCGGESATCGVEQAACFSMSGGRPRSEGSCPGDARGLARRQRIARRAVRDGDRSSSGATGAYIEFERAAARPPRAAEHGADLVAPMPGRVRRTLVRGRGARRTGQVAHRARGHEDGARDPGPAATASSSGFRAREGDLVDAGAELARSIDVAGCVAHGYPGKSTRSGGRTCRNGSPSTRSAPATACRTRRRRSPSGKRAFRRPADRRRAAGRSRSGSFVSPRAVPQLADTEEVFRRIHKASGVRYPALVPNEKGLERALAAGVREIAVFTAASETFNRHNINAGVDESIERFRPVVERARAKRRSACADMSRPRSAAPTKGDIAPEAVREVVHKLLDLPVDEISIGDTIGVATPGRRLRRDRDALRLRRDPRRPGPPLSRHPRHGARQRVRGPGVRHYDFRRFGRRARRLPLRAGRVGQPGHGGPASICSRGSGSRRASRFPRVSRRRGPCLGSPRAREAPRAGTLVARFRRRR